MADLGDCEPVKAILLKRKELDIVQNNFRIKQLELRILELEHEKNQVLSEIKQRQDNTRSLQEELTKLKI